MNGFKIWAIVIFLCLTVGVAADLYVQSVIDVEVAGYHSCTKAFDMRCDYYLEYEGVNLINVTKTENCVWLDEFEGC